GRGAVRPAVGARVHDALPAGGRPADRRRHHQQGAPPGVARGVRVPRAPASALLRARTSTPFSRISETLRPSTRTCLAHRRVATMEIVSKDRRTDVPLPPVPPLPTKKSEPAQAEPPAFATGTHPLSLTADPRYALRDLEDQLDRCLAALTMHFQP